MDFTRPLSVVTPTLDGDILGVLAQGEVKLTGRELGKRVGGSQEGVRRVLDRLVRQGVVLRETAGRAHLHSLNRRHLAAPAIERLATLRPQLIQRLRETIGAWTQPPEAALLFGSAARAHAGEKSDIDLLVIRADGMSADDAAWRRQLEDLAENVTAMTGNDARVLEYAAAEISGPRRPAHVASALHDGIPLFGSPGRSMKRGPGRRAKP
jgi:predicted nucleotidyltransferase